MSDLIRDPLWTFIGASFTFLAIIVTFALYLAQRKKRRFVYEFGSRTRLLGVEEELRGKVKVLYDGNEVKNVYLLKTRFINTGNQPISSTDFERSLSMIVNEGATILTHEIVDESPSNLGAKLSVVENRFEIP